MIIAGKGHEHGQYVAGSVIPFDDREVAAAALRGRLAVRNQAHLAPERADGPADEMLADA